MRFYSSCSLVSFTTALAFYAATSDAIVVARATRRGYIIVDDTERWGERVPSGNTRELANFIGETTQALDAYEGFRAGRFLAAMQIPHSTESLAFYLPIRNEVRGIGQRSVIDGRSEVFDSNAFYDTAFALDGFVYLNSYRFYTDPRAVTFGRFLICTQEFGHRFGANIAAPPFPTGVRSSGGTDGGAPDAVGASDASVDAGGGDGGPVALARDEFLGRGNRTTSGMVVNRAHWSYFFHSGGSPMEGNNWTEVSPGTFRTERPTFRFSPIDLYLMGLIPAAEVPNTFLIASPQNVPRNVNRDSPPEYYNRQVTITGRRVDVSIDDVIRANGVRNPAYPTTDRDLNVVWVLLASEADVSDELAAEFDEAVDSCAMGYTFATGDRGRLVAMAPLQPDAGASNDATSRDASARDVPFDPDVPSLPPPDGMTVSDADVVAQPPSFSNYRAEGGCQCTVLAPRASSPAAFVLLALGVVVVGRRRRVA